MTARSVSPTRTGSPPAISLETIFGLFPPEVELGGSAAFDLTTARDLDIFFPTEESLRAFAQARALPIIQWRTWDGNHVTLARWTVRGYPPIDLLYADPPHPHQRVRHDGSLVNPGVRFDKPATKRARDRWLARRSRRPR